MNTILKEREKTFDIVVENIFSTFPFESLHKQKVFLTFSNQWKEKIQTLPLNDDAFFLFLEQFLASLKNAHTRLGQYYGKVWYSPLGFSVKRIQKKFYLFSHDKLLGTIQKINGVSPDKLFRYHKKRVAASTAHYRDIQATKFLLFSKKEESVSLRYIEKTKRHSVIIPREKIIRSSFQEKNISYKILKKSIGFLRIPSWGNLLDVQKQFSKIINQIARKKVEKIVIDVRGNGGGDANTVVMFAAHFFKTSTFFGSVQMRKNTEEFSFEKKDFYITPKHPYIDSKITILADEQCLSSNEFFIAGFKDNHRAFVKGEKTGGSSGNPKKFPIPYKEQTFELFVSTWKYFRPNGKPLEGKGIEPNRYKKPEKIGRYRESL